MTTSAFLELTGRDDDEVAVRKLRAMRRLVLMTLAFEGWAALRYFPYSESPGFHAAIATALGLCALLGWNDRFARAAVGSALALETLTVISVFPHNANHQYLAIALLVLIALAFSGAAAGADGGTSASADSSAVPARPERGPRVDPGDARAAVAAMRWVVLSGLAWSGVMKLRYGYWLGGEFLSYQIATDPGFARVFAPIVPGAEWARLVALENRIGAGPFRAQAPLLVAVSNLTWLAELVLPIGLLGSRTRTIAMVASLALLIAIQVGAREIFFAGIMIGGLLLFDRRDRVSAFLPVAALCHVVWLAWPAIARQLAAGAAP